VAGAEGYGDWPGSTPDSPRVQTDGLRISRRSALRASKDVPHYQGRPADLASALEWRIDRHDLASGEQRPWRVPRIAHACEEHYVVSARPSAAEADAHAGLYSRAR
jgi:hypothetical protein